MAGINLRRYDEFFIDRNPALFTHVLEWLRSGSLDSLPDGAAMRRGLMNEADYFGGVMQVELV